MKSCFVTFRSVTFAQRGEGILSRAGISGVLQRTPRWMEEQGCGYCLRLRESDAPGAVALLRRNRVAFRRVYRRGPEGDLEELVL